MRRLSKKRARLDRQLRQQRSDFVAEYPQCMCGCGERATACHEMACGWSNRPQAIQHRFCWLSLSDYCNQYEFTNYAKWPLERQLALKWIHDREHLDLVAFNRLRGRADSAITMADVIPWICRELDGNG